MVNLFGLHNDNTKSLRTPGLYDNLTAKEK